MLQTFFCDPSELLQNRRGEFIELLIIAHFCYLLQKMVIE